MLGKVETSRIRRNDVLELDSGRIALVEAMRQEIDLEGRRIVSRRDSPTRVTSRPCRSSFTLVPHAYSWLTEQRPLAAVLGDGLELALQLPGPSTLSARQVDDEPYGGGAGMVLRVESSPRRWTRSTAARRSTVSSRDPGREAVTQEVSGARGGRAVDDLSARFEGFDERSSRISRRTRSRSVRTCSRTATCGDALVDAVVRLLPGGSGAPSRACTRASRPSSSAGSSTPH